MTMAAEKRFSRPMIIGVVSLSLLGLGGAAFALWPKRTASQYITDAQVYVNKGDYSAALIQMRNAVKREPRNAEARYQLALVSLRSGDAVSAEKEIKVAQELGYSEQKVLPILATAYLEQSKHEILLKNIPESDRSPEIESVIRVLRGMSQLSMRDIEAAEASFQSALSIVPQQLRAEIGLARIDAIRQDYQAAGMKIDQVLAKQPSRDILSEIYLLQGQIRRLDKDNEGAILAFSNLIELAPTMIRARTERAELYMEQNLDYLAEQDVEYILLKRSFFHPQAAHLKAVLALRAGDEDAAYERLQRQGAGLGQHPPSLLLMGQLQLKRKQLELAQTNFTEYLKAVPDNTEARLILADLMMQKNLPDQAISVLKAVPNIAGGPDIRVLRLLASASIRAGRESEAGAWLDKVALASNAARARSQTGVESVGPVDVVIESNGESDQKSIDSQILLMLTRLREGRLDEAERLARSFQAETPNSPIPDNLLGGVSMAQGDRAGARFNFEKALGKKSDFIPARLNIAKLDAAEGRLDDAVEQYKLILSQDPRNSEVMIALAELSLRQQRLDDSEAWLSKAVGVDPKAVTPRISQVNYYLSLKNYDKAIKAALDLRTIAPTNFDAMDSVGRVQIASGNFAAAVDTYRKMLSTSALMPTAHERLAQALLAVGDTNGAKNALRIGLTDNPDSTSLVMQLTNLLQRLGEPGAALKAAQDWQRRHPSLAIGDVMVANVLEQQGKFRDAATSLSSAFKKEMSTTTIIALARTRMAAGNGETAVQELQKWTVDHPQDVAARDALASMLIAQKRFDLATRESEELLKLQPNSPIILNNLAWLYSKGNDPRALDYAERALALAPRVPSIMDTAGFIMISQGKFDQGIPLLRQAYEMSQKTPEIGYHLAIGLARSQQVEEAKSVLEAILADSRPFENKTEAKKLLDSFIR